VPSFRFGIGSIRLLAVIGAIGSACFLTSTVVANILQPTFDPGESFVSDLALGPVGYLMTTSFWLHGVAIFALAIGLNRGVTRTPSHRIAVSLLAVGAVGVVLLGFFPTDPGLHPHTVSGRLHIAIAGTAFTSLSIAFLLFVKAFRGDPHWGANRWWAPTLAVLVLMALAVFGFVLLAARLDWFPQAANWVGAAERLLIGFNLAWIFLASLHLRAIISDPAHAVEEDGSLVIR
jgi:hypothetical membrane protein